MSDSVYLPKDHFDATWDQETLDADDLELPEALDGLELAEDVEHIAEVAQGLNSKTVDNWNDHGIDELLSVTLGAEVADKGEGQLQVIEGASGNQ